MADSGCSFWSNVFNSNFAVIFAQISAKATQLLKLLKINQIFLCLNIFVCFKYQNINFQYLNIYVYELN